MEETTEITLGINLCSSIGYMELFLALVSGIHVYDVGFMMLSSWMIDVYCYVVIQLGWWQCLVIKLDGLYT